MKTLCILLLGFVAAAQAITQTQVEWEEFTLRYGKTHVDDEERTKRYNIFRENLDYINEHNKLYDAGESSYSLAVNQFTDLTHEEFVAQFNGFSTQGQVRDPDSEYLPSLEKLPKSVDWRTKGYVTPVKDQKQCGSCWAFSATGAIEGAHFKKTGKLVSLSEQNLVDCDKHSYGCNGGLMDSAFQYVTKNGGIATEASYPYKARNRKCKFNKAKIGAKISSHKHIKKGSEKALTDAIAKVGPISVGIDASHNSFQHYHKGVYDEKKCSSSHLDHGVLAVGYGSVDGKDYYIVKNSWSESWGNKGYIWMSRNKKNQCGIASSASFPIV